MLTLDGLLAAIDRKWGEEHRTPSQTSAQITEFEARTGRTLPEDFRTYVLGLRLMASDCADDHGFQFLPLADVRHVPDFFFDLDPDAPVPTGEERQATISAYSGMYEVATCMIDTDRFAIRLTDDGLGTVYWFPLSMKPIVVAPSWTALLRKYHEDPWLLMEEWPPGES